MADNIVLQVFQNGAYGLVVLVCSNALRSEMQKFSRLPKSTLRLLRTSIPVSLHIFSSFFFCVTFLLFALIICR